MDEHLTKAEMKAQRKEERHESEIRDKQKETSNKMKRMGMWIGGIVVLGLCVWGLIALVNTPTTPNTTNLTAPAVSNTDIAQGPKNAKVTLIEYADFQCPACGAYFPVVQQLRQQYGNKVLFVYRYFPLTSIHQNAMLAAQAAEAARQQGKFWEMHDMLYQHQNDWATLVDPKPVFQGYASALGLDKDKFNADMVSSDTINFINKEEDAGTQAGVNATPTFFLNGKEIQNPASADDFKKLINQALQ